MKNELTTQKYKGFRAKRARRQGLLLALALTILGAITSLRAFAQEAPTLSYNVFDHSTDNRFFSEWYTNIRSASFDENPEQGRYIRFVLGWDFRLRMAPRLSLLGGLNLRQYTGQIQTRVDDSLASGILMNEMTLAVDASREFQFRFGVNNQAYLNSRFLMMRDRSLPGFMERFEFGDAVVIRFILQQAIPTVRTTDARVSEKVAIPSFFTETLEIESGKNANPIKWQSFLTHYRFNDLSTQVAYDSALGGNTVVGEVSANTRFKYDFDGVLGGGEVCYCLEAGRVDVIGGGHVIQNLQAPEGARRGQSLYGKLNIHFGDIVVSPKYESFFNETDTAPAQYNTVDYIGHNNRVGHMIGTDVEFLRWKFKVSGKYAKSDLINPSPFQANREIFMLTVETRHVF